MPEVSSEIRARLNSLGRAYTPGFGSVIVDVSTTEFPIGLAPRCRLASDADAIVQALDEATHHMAGHVDALSPVER